MDNFRIAGLLGDLGEAAAQRMMRRVLGEIADRIVRVEASWEKGSPVQIRKAAARIVTLADQVGLSGLAHVAQDVAQLTDTPDNPALAACIHRLRRVGDTSVLALWEWRGRTG